MSSNSERRYDLDWLRVMAILLVLVFHVAMIYCSFGFHIKNKPTSRVFDYFIMFAHQWRMPLLLLISGAGTYYAAGKRSIGKIFKERNRRLLIPLIFSMLVIVPPQIYFERIANFSSYWNFYKTVFAFIPYPEGGSLSWHHMWFVLYLLLYSILALPLLSFLRKNPEGKFVNAMDKYFSGKWSFLSAVIFIVATQIILRPYFPEETHSLLDDWAYFVQYGCYFLLGLLISSRENIWSNLEKRRRFHLVTGIISVLFMWVMYAGLWGIVMKFIPNDTIQIIWDINEIIIGVSWVLAILGYGKKYLNRKSAFLQYSNEGIYPFYILHQTVIIFIGYYFMQFSNSILGGFFTISLLSFIITVLIYILIVRPFNFMRFLFGMKTLKKAAAPELRVIASETSTN